MSSETSKGIWIAVITGLLAILGTAVKGFADISLERAKLDSQLIIGALSSTSVEQRRESLRFLVDTDLIGNDSTKEGLSTYFEGERPKSPPQMSPFIQSGQSITLSGQTLENSSKTDLDLFVCGSSKSNDNAKLLIDNLHNKISSLEHFGSSKLKVWDGNLYEEIAEDTLKGYLTIIVDQHLDESLEIPAIKNVIGGISGLPPINVVNNVGPKTPWRISIVLCM